MPEPLPIIYFHGIPGSAEELTLFGPEVARRTAGFHVLARDGSSLGADSAYFDKIAAILTASYPGQVLHFIGFSLGAAAALRVAARLGSQVARIELVSPAAPLQLGDYLGEMAGAPVFSIAKSHPRLFSIQCMAQSWFARFAPATLARMLFASAQGADQDLLTRPAFRKGIAAVLRRSAGHNRWSYRREISLYVDDWTDMLSEVTQPVSIDHGALDNWSPVAMAHDLARALPTCNRLTIHPGLSHYSTLATVLMRRLA